MSSIQEGLVAYLEAQVSSAGSGYPNEVPQGVTGWAYSVISDIQDIGHGGALNFYKARIQLDLMYAATSTKSAYKVTQEIAAAMRAKLDGYQGAMGTVTVEFCKTEITDEWADNSESPSTRFDVVINYKL